MNRFISPQIVLILAGLFASLLPFANSRIDNPSGGEKSELQVELEKNLPAGNLWTFGSGKKGKGSPGLVLLGFFAVQAVLLAASIPGKLIRVLSGLTTLVAGLGAFVGGNMVRGYTGSKELEFGLVLDRSAGVGLYLMITVMVAIAVYGLHQVIWPMKPLPFFPKGGSATHTP